MWAEPGSGERHQNTAKFHLDSGVRLRAGSTEAEQGQHAICGKPALLDIKAPSKRSGDGVATFLRVYRSRSFIKICQAGRRRAPPW